MPPPIGSPVKYDYLRIAPEIEPCPPPPPLEFGQKNGLTLSEDLLFFGFYLRQFGILLCFFLPFQIPG